MFNLAIFELLILSLLFVILNLSQHLILDMYLARGVCNTLSNIYDGNFHENTWRLLAVHYFCKRFHHWSKFLKVIFHKFYLDHSWILCPIFVEETLNYTGIDFLRDRLQILPLMLSEFKGTDLLLFSLKSSENLRFSGDFRMNRSDLIHLNSINIRVTLGTIP